MIWGVKQFNDLQSVKALDIFLKDSDDVIGGNKLVVRYDLKSNSNYLHKTVREAWRD